MTQIVDFPRGIEVITGVLIHNGIGEILFIKSPKWPDVLTIPGGHVEPGETIAESAVREADEETGLHCKFVTILSFVEMINPKHFYRIGHFIAFSCLLDATDNEITFDKREVYEYYWLKPHDALAMKDLAPTVKKPLLDYLEYVAGKNK